MKKIELRKWRETYTPYTGTCLSEGLQLNVHFDEKCWVKQLGARWHPDSSGTGGYWWMPINRLSQHMRNYGYGDISEIVNIFDPDRVSTLVKNLDTPPTVLDWLNKNKMISGKLYGELDKNACNEASLDETPKQYSLILADGTPYGFDFYKELDIVLLNSSNEKKNWAMTEDARSIWDALVSSGAKVASDRTENHQKTP